MKPTRFKSVFSVIAILFFMAIPFQNCAQQGFEGTTAADALAGASSSSSSGSGTSPHIHPAGETAVPLMEYFTILPGTGSGPWNTMSLPMVVYVGQTLRITNNDSVEHRMHTGGKPCPHQQTASAPFGGFYDCVISGETTGTATVKDYALYDHMLGSASKFYVRVYDGVKIYEQKCAGCHSTLLASEVRANDVSTITWAIQNVSAMKGIALTPEEIEALEIALK